MQLISGEKTGSMYPRQWRRFLLNGGGSGGVPSGDQGQSPWSGGRAPGQEIRASEGHSPPPEAEKKLNFDNTKPL